MKVEILMLKSLNKIRFFIFNKKIIKYKYILFNIINTIMSALGMTVNLIFFKFVLDSISYSRNKLPIIKYIFLFILYLFISSLIKIWINDIYNPKQNLLIQKSLQKIMFDKIKTLDISCFSDSEFYNKYVRAMNEIENRFFQIVDTILQLITGIFSVLSIGIFISTLKPIYIFFALAMVINTMIRAYKTNKYKYLLDKENTKNQRIITYIKRVFYLEQYVMDFKLFPLFNIFTKIYDTTINNIINIIEKLYKKIRRIDFLNSIISIIINIAIIYSLCINVINNTLSVSDFMILFTSINNMSSSLSGILSTIPNISIHSLYIDNLMDVLNYQPKIFEDNSGIKLDDFESISFKNISFSYVDNSKCILTNISLSINKGMKVAIVGRNGSGKSTLIKLLFRLYDPQCGIAKMNAINYKDININSLRTKFGVMFQDSNMYSLTIAENILMESINCKEQEDLVWDALRFSGLYEKIKKLDTGINTILTKEFDNDGIYLSGGEKQLLFIARAYALKRSILIFDEPSNSLDVFFEHQLFNKLRNIGKDKTVIFITHNLYSTVDADIIYFLEDGKIIEKGTHNELINLNGKYKDMYEIQLTRYSALK